MGFFSHNCSIDKESIPAYPWAELPQILSQAVLVLPNNKVIKGVYDGYGHFDGVDMYDELAKAVYGEEYDRNKIFSDDKYITAPDGTETTIKQFKWDEPIALFDGMTLNQMTKAGYKIDRNFNRTEHLVKVVRLCNYTGQKFEELETSESCDFQGFFYDEKSAIKLEKLAGKYSK